jgi:2-C-methyl-D-erythritol 2,4-cyclodiphosphate synthase
MRIGYGYDLHRLARERALILGGHKIDFRKGLDGHSDADVLLHAIIDALLGAAGLGDIGKHFPPSDESYRGISSLLLLERTAKLIGDAGYAIGNIDATIVCQEPRLAPHIPMMIEKTARAAGCAENAINIKATTEEGLGVTGTGEAISASAVALIIKK